MARAYNFSAGPAALPEAVLLEAQAEFFEYQDWRAAVMEVSHRSAGFMRMQAEVEAQLRELLEIGEDYAVLFLAGGARGQTAAIPMNLAGAEETAAYVLSGHWSRLAAEEAQRFCRVHIAADSGGDYTTLSPPAAWEVPADAAYVHIVENETVHGVEYPAAPRCPAAAVPLVADLTSNIATRRLNISDYALVYAAAQKTLGIAGVTLVVVRRDILRATSRAPLVWDYAAQAKSNSMCNTPPTFAVYMLGRMLAWMQAQGGIAQMEAASCARAEMLYGALDESAFYRAAVQDTACRSRVNVPFFLTEERLTADFLAGAEARGLLGLAGHKALGGVRASMYNSMPLAGVAALVEYMREFERERG